MVSLTRGPAGTPKRKKKKSRDAFFFYSIVVFIGVFFCIEVALFNYLEEGSVDNHLKEGSVDNHLKEGTVERTNLQKPPKNPAKTISLPEHLLPHIPILPLFDSIPNAHDHISNLLDGRPTMAGVVALLQNFVSDLHDNNMKMSKAEADGEAILENFYDLAAKHLKPFDDAYRGKHIFPIREDGSIFISLAAFREFYLLETLISAFRNAENPEKVFVGAVVQNCFGKFREDGSLDTSGKPCYMGKQVVGTDADGNEIKDTPAIPPEKNAVAAFCALPDYAQFCKNGQVRVLYMHHTDGQGPSMARYLASKLWGGENYFMQIDSHLRFADDWDAKYIADIKLTSNYPKSVFSSYPPGFDQVRFIPKHMGVDKSKINNETVIESPGCRLCHCNTPKQGKNPMIIIQQSKSYYGFEDRPAQQPFLGAGLVFTHGNFLKEIPYDPYLPWTFMGEEIILSMRAWTNGWNMYAPRKNLIIHQYRPAKLGLPKFYASVASIFKNGSVYMQRRVIRRMKYLAGYPGHTAKKIRKDDLGFVLTEVDKYGMGTERTLEEFIKFSQIEIDDKGNLVCTKRLDWCMDQKLY